MIEITPSYPTTTGVFTFKSVASSSAILTQCASTSGVSGIDLYTETGSGTF